MKIGKYSVWNFDTDSSGNIVRINCDRGTVEIPLDKTINIDKIEDENFINNLESLLDGLLLGDTIDNGE